MATKASQEKTPIPKENPKPETPKPENTDPSKEECKYLFPPKRTTNPLPFAQFIPTVIAIALFVYGWVTSSPNDATTSLKGCYIIYIIGFFIVFMQAFTNMFDSEWWDYYNKMIKSKSGPEQVFWTIKTVLVTCIEPLRSNIKIIGGRIPVGWVEYFNYPLNYLIFTSVMIAICVAFMGWIVTFEKCHGEDNPKTKTFNTFNVMKRFSGEGDSGAFSLLQGGLAVVGILFSILTNWFIMKGLDPDEKLYFKLLGKKPHPWGGKHKPNLCWIMRIVRWTIGIFSMVILGYWYSKWTTEAQTPAC